MAIANFAINSGLVWASGQGAPTTSMSYTIPVWVNEQTGTLSTGLPSRAAKSLVFNVNSFIDHTFFNFIFSNLFLLSTDNFI